MNIHRIVAALVWAAALALYTATSAPSIVELFDDSLEFQLVGPTFGIAHPTGYPLYTLLGGLWSRLLLPFGNWAWRMNMLSALCAAAAVWLVYLLGARLAAAERSRPSVWGGVAAAGAFALSPVWWAQATIAEVYALHILLTAAILYAALAVADAADVAQQVNRRMALLAALLGLGLAHHRMTALLLPGLAVYLLWAAPGLWRLRRAWLGWLAALLAPLLLYAYIPLRAAGGVSDLHGSYVNTWQGFWDHILARSYQSFFADNPLAVERSADDWFGLFIAQFGAAGLVLATVGLTRLFWPRRQSQPWVLVLLTLIANLLFALNYRVGDVEVFLLPVFLCLALFIGGAVGLLDAVGGERLPGRTRRTSLAAQAALAALVLAGVGGRSPAVDRSDDWAVHDYAVALAKTPFPPDSRVVGLEGEVTALKYMQQAEKLGQAATGVVSNDPARRAATVAELAAQGAPVYLTRELQGIEQLYSFTGEGVLVRVWPRGQAAAGAPAQAANVQMLDGILAIEGYDLALLKQAGGPALEFAIYWRPSGPVERDLKVSLRPLAADGSPILAPDGAAVTADLFPLRQVAPTSAWLPGELIRDVYILPLPAGQLARTAALLAVVYDSGTVEEVGRLQVDVAHLTAAVQ